MLIGEVYMPFNLAKKLDSMGIERDMGVKLECNVPDRLCDVFVLQLYRAGYSVSMEDGAFGVLLGPVKTQGTDSAVLWYSIMGKRDSVVFEYTGQAFDIKRETRSKKGILSGLIFILMGYLLFFVIK